MEFVDVQITQMIPTFQSQLQELLNLKQNTSIIGSFHCLDGSVPWTGTLSNQTMQSMYDLMHPWADVIKLIGVARTLNDNFDCFEFSQKQSCHKRLIAMNMGPLGQLSRALNMYMTPVTHPLLTLSAASGQLSVKEIHQLRHKIGLLKSKKFYLFGSPIKQSMSPTLHNTGFEELGLPFEYSLFESSNADQVLDVIQNQNGFHDFGGASVTIPLKESLFKKDVFVEMSESVKKIGALNTITFNPDLNGLTANNTDWLGIKGCIDSVTCLSSSLKSFIGIVIGAGGTARAACYALQRIQGVNEIRIWNRTIERARALALEFDSHLESDIHNLLSLSSSPSSNEESKEASKTEFIVISTIPAPAQDSIDWDSLLSHGQGIVVDMAYRPRETPLLKSAKRKSDSWVSIQGIQVLLEQGFYQFEEWTRISPLRNAIQESVMKAYSG